MAGQIRSFAAPVEWHQIDDKQIFMGEAVVQAHGYPMSVGFARMAAGESAAIPAPYHEVWMVTGGVVAIRGNGPELRAHTGELLYVPAGAAGTAYAEADVELVLVAHPPYWRFQPQDWEAVRARPVPGATGHVVTAAAVTSWEPVDGQQFRLGYLPEPAGGVFGLGFGRVRGDVTAPLSFPEDAVVAAARGRFTLQAEGEPHTVPAGQFAYLPAGAVATLHAGPGTELVVARHHLG